MNTNIQYNGDELVLFQYATNWKKYFSSFFKKYVEGVIIEVGAGIGSTTPFLLSQNITSYTCIEPDAKLANQIIKQIDSKKLPAVCTVFKGVLSDLDTKSADLIFYIDVIEHIENDKAELLNAARSLKAGGFLCLLVPANPSDFSSFDRAIGHFRRYTKESLLDVIPSNLKVVKCRYIDSIGAIASKANKYLLKQYYPTKAQILFWDRILIPISKIVDPLIAYSAGKSLLLIAQKL